MIPVFLYTCKYQKEREQEPDLQAAYIGPLQSNISIVKVENVMNDTCIPVYL